MVDFLSLGGLILELVNSWNGRTSERAKLAAYLEDIAELCGKARDNLQSNEVPRVEGKALAIIVNSADKIASKMESREPAIYSFFTDEVLLLGKVLRDADFFIDGKPRTPTHHRARSYDVELRTELDRVDAAQTNIMHQGLIDKCCIQLESVEGQAIGHAATLRNQ